MNIKKLFLAFSCFITSTLFCKPKKRSLQPGDKAPQFALLDQKGNIRTLEEFKGRKVVLFFYPKDDTPNCTKEACSLRDAFDIYEKNNIVVLGISYDSVTSHAKFQKKHRLPFSLLSDTTGEVAAAYGANRCWPLNNVAPKRKTFLINEDGIIVTVMDKVNVQTHADEILKMFGAKKF